MGKITTLIIAILFTTSLLSNEVPSVEVDNHKQMIETLEKLTGNKISFEDDNLVLVVDGVKKDKSFISSLSISDIKSVNIKSGTQTELRILTK
jgi:hypothetical protein